METMNLMVETMPVKMKLETMPVETKHETMPVDLKLEIMPVETKLETMPVEIKLEIMSVETKHETMPVDLKLEAMPVDTKLEIKSVETKHDTMPVEIKLEFKPLDSQTIQTVLQDGSASKEKLFKIDTGRTSDEFKHSEIDFKMSEEHEKVYDLQSSDSVLIDHTVIENEKLSIDGQRYIQMDNLSSNEAKGTPRMKSEPPYHYSDDKNSAEDRNCAKDKECFNTESTSCDLSEKISFDHRKVQASYSREKKNSYGQVKNEVFSCLSCPQTFTTVLLLKQHEEEHIYNEENPYKCKKCGKGFFDKNDYQRHEARTHKPYHIGYMAYGSSVPKSMDNDIGKFSFLNAHKFAYEGKSKHACPICPRTFEGKSSLSLHLIGGHVKKRF